MTETPKTQIDRPEDAPGAFQAAWNAHDMGAFGSLFDEDATFVNRFGHYVRGIDEIVALHVPIHETIYRDSTLQNELIDVGEIETGMTHINSPTTGGEAHIPFGGVKMTGIGAREQGSTALDFYTELKVVYVDYTGRKREGTLY
ncbi:MAG: aldehyde dehydrogenase family protein [Pyrinomonadaceae bacterium]